MRTPRWSPSWAKWQPVYPDRVRLFVVRHAEAAPGDPDAMRPLTPAGRGVARSVGEQLAREKPDAVLCSPLLRARETAAPIARAAGVELEPDERLAPGTTAAHVREAVEGRGGTVVVVGHQPDCSEIVLELSGREVKFEPGAVVEVEL
jgi:phosphohistidine phosphatase SixA